MKGQTNNFVLSRLQRTLWRNMTDAEQALWKRLRGCLIKGRKFRRQHLFGDFTLDFVCLEAKLVVEIDGGQHNGSTQDLVRDQIMESAGFRVMRFWNNQVLSEIKSVVEAVWLALEPHPHPNLPPEGEGTIALPLEGAGVNVGGIHRPHPHRPHPHRTHPHRTHPHPNPPLEGEGANAE